MREHPFRWVAVVLSALTFVALNVGGVYAALHSGPHGDPGLIWAWNYKPDNGRASDG